MNKRFMLTLGVISAGLIITGCATSPMGRSQLTLMPANELNQMGLQAFDKLKKDQTIETNPKINRYVKCVAGAITQEVEGKWEVVVFTEDSPNAFALPGGKIGVHTGLLKVATSQDQLAAVLGHEVSHVLANHGNERVSQKMAVETGMKVTQAIANTQGALGRGLMGVLGVGAQYGILLPFSRVHESEADLLGLDLMAKAGFDPRGSVALWQNMAKAGGAGSPEFMSTHPSHSTRIADLQARIPSAMALQKQARANGKNPTCGNGL